MSRPRVPAPPRVLGSLLVTACLLALACSKQPPSPPAHAAPAAGSAVAHADHDPKHGGVFFMAPDDYHHLEGTYPEEGLFRLWLYDDHTRPIDAKPFGGTLRLDAEPEEAARPLELDPATRTLVGRLSPSPMLPVDLVLLLQIRDRKTGDVAEHRFDFRFTRAGGEPVAPKTAGSGPAGGQVVSVDGLRLELASMGGSPALYVRDASGEARTADGMSGSLHVQPPDGEVLVIPLAAMGNHLMGSARVMPGSVVVASVVVDGKTRVARFQVP